MRNASVCNYREKRCFLAGVIILSFLLFHSPCLSAETSATGPATLGAVKITVDGGIHFQPKTHISGGGDLTVTRYMTGINAKAPVSDKVELGLGLSYEFDDYYFSGLGSFSRQPGLGAPDPWNKVHRLGLTGRMAYKAGPKWNLFFSPMVQYAGEEGAEAGKSILYGGVVGAVYAPHKDLTIGLGSGAFYRLEQTTVYPALIISWNITKRLHLVNPYRTGPTGPAGLELNYDLDKNWLVGLGGGYHSYRFRLADSNQTPNGIGQVSSVPVYLSLERKFENKLRAYLFAGLAFGGGLRIEDRSGDRIDSASYATAPIFGFAVAGTF